MLLFNPLGFSFYLIFIVMTLRNCWVSILFKRFTNNLYYFNYININENTGDFLENGLREGAQLPASYLDLLFWQYYSNIVLQNSREASYLQVCSCSLEQPGDLRLRTVMPSGLPIDGFSKDKIFFVVIWFFLV